MRGVSGTDSERARLGRIICAGWCGKTGWRQSLRALNASMGSYDFVCWTVRHHQRSKQGRDTLIPQKGNSGGAPWCTQLRREQETLSVEQHAAGRLLLLFKQRVMET